jgi:glycerol uptake facilitator-like aquaporin
MFSDTFAGIAPSSVPAFIAAQIVGGVIAVVVIWALYPRLTPEEASDIIVPHHASQATAVQDLAAYDAATSPAGRQSGRDASP